MAKLNMKQIEDLWEDDNAEEVTESRKRGQENQSGLISTKISKITRDLIQSDEDKELLKTDPKRLKKK